MENGIFSDALPAWVKSAKAFLKVQADVDDNRLQGDTWEGFADYCLWSKKGILLAVAGFWADFSRRNEIIRFIRMAKNVY